MFFNVSIYLLLGILVITAVLMVLIVLMQRPKNEGLGASFGGGMTQDLFGAQTTNVLQKFTVYLGAIFFASCLLLTVLYSKSSTKQSDIQKNLAAVAAAKKALPKASATPAPAAITTPAPTDAATPTATPEAVTAPIPTVDATPTMVAPDVPMETPATLPAEAPAATATP